MFTATGIKVDSWVRIEGHCDISCEVVGDEAQFRFGGVRSPGLDMVVTEEGLKNLVQASTDALRAMRAEAERQAGVGEAEGGTSAGDDPSPSGYGRVEVIAST